MTLKPPCPTQVLHNAARALPPADPVPELPKLPKGLPDVGAKLLAGPKSVGEIVAVDEASTAGPQKGASMSLQLECLAIVGVRKRIHPTTT